MEQYNPVQLPKHIVENNEKLLRAYQAVFSTEAGKVVLDDLKARTTDKPTWNPDLSVNHGFVREGQNMIVRLIEKRIEEARNWNYNNK